MSKKKLSANRFLTANYLGAKLVWNNFKGIFLAQLTLVSVNSALSFLQPAIFALLINRLAGNPIFDPNLITLVTLLVIVSIAPSFIYTLLGYFNKMNYLKLERLLEIEMVGIYGRLDVSQHEDPKVKDLITRVSEEGQWRVKNFIERLVFITQDVLSLIIASVILVRAEWWTLPVLLLATIPELIVSNKYGRDVWSISSSQSEDRRFFWDLRGHFTYLPYLLELKLFQNLKAFQQKLIKMFSKFLSAQIKNELSKATRLIFAQAVSQLANALVGVLFIYQVVQGEILIGTLTFLIATIGQFRNSLSGFFFSISSQYQDGLFVDDFFTLKDMPNKLEKPQIPTFIDSKTTPRIEFKNVSFKYPSKDDLVLKNINLVIEPGTKLALVGINGAGKTTFVKLLCRFYDPAEGQILINGVDLAKLDLESWYHHLGILFQEYARYHFKVKDSIKVGRSDTNISSNVVKASKQAGSHDFILNWPKKYKQQLGRDFSDGVEPSIGQWQKLALARVFYRDPSIFILDEPTASLDAEAEANIFNHLDSLEKGKTTILISHRFSTVRKADKIIVIDNGKISEEGTHKDLISQNGKYAKLFNLQAEGYQG